MKTVRLLLICVATVLIAVAWKAIPAHQGDKPLAVPQSVPPQSNLPRQSAPQLVSVQQQNPAAPAAQETAPGSTAQEEETERRLGPFPIAGSDYVVVLHEKKCVPGSTEPHSDIDLGESVVAMGIRDATGAVLYQRRFPYSSGDENGSQAWKVSASTLAGTSGTGLLVDYSFDLLPSAPEWRPSVWWQIFGVVKGKLKAFSGPLPFDAGLVRDETSGEPYRTTAPLDPRADTLEFKVSTGQHLNFIYPVRIDWHQGRLSPAKPCERTSSSGSGEGCQYKVLAEDYVGAGEATFVTLYSSAGEKCEKPEKVAVRPDSKLEFLVVQLGAERWSDGLAAGPSGKSGINDTMDDQGGPSWAPNIGPWLKLRIDGKEGWINSQEDFDALGLTQEL